jgi:formiminotetrahydrofolate cyclodeaminase
LDDLNARVTQMSDRIDALQHTILVVGGGLFAAFVAALAGMLGVIVALIVTHA